MNYSQVTLDILQNDKYAGAIESVQWITKWIDSGFGMVITMVAFLIILVAMLKNVLAAAYCAYPNFWDHVDEAHQAVKDKGWIAQLKEVKADYQNINGGSISTALFQMLPNIKAMTDFKEEVSAKQYFIRAIPQMLLCVIIGAFIYNGYYRDVASKVVDFGSEMTKRVILEVDPIAIYDKFTGSSGRPTFASDGSVVPKTQLVNKIASEMYNKVIGTYTDVSGAEAKRALATAIEDKATAWVDELANTDPTYVDGESWKTTLYITLREGEPELSLINGATSNDGLTKQYATKFPVSDLNMSTTINVNSNTWVACRVDFQKQAVQSGAHAVRDLTLHVTLASDGTVTLPSNAVLRLERIPANCNYKVPGGRGYVHVEVASTANSEITLKFTATDTSLSGTLEAAANAITLTDTANNTVHTIEYIEIATGGTSGYSLSSASEGQAYTNLDCTTVGVTGASTEPTATPAPSTN